MIPQEALGSIIKSRETVSPAGAVQEYHCTDYTVIGQAVWTLWRQYVGDYPVGCHIELDIIRFDSYLGWCRDTELEHQGFSRTDCPLEYVRKSAPIDRDWRDKVWKVAEGELAANAEGKSHE